MKLSNITKKFNPGDFVITSEGEKGYIIEATDTSETKYYIRLMHDYHIKSVHELNLDSNFCGKK